MKIIAFDLGRNFAWAHNYPSNKSLKTQSVIFEGERAWRQAQLLRLLSTIEWGCFNIAVYETPFARGRDATRSLWGIAGIIEACASHGGLPVVDVAVPTIKKFATGDGRAPKEAMIAAAKKFGYKSDNEHEADAVCLLRYAEANLERAPCVICL